MSRPRHLLVRASAGTGKTYELTSRYLALLFAGADPGTILATTFTRKAAHEIQDRVLARLAGAARGGAELDRLRVAVGRDVGAGECLDLLAKLLRGVERIRIVTIDAFFAQLARLFALDVGMQPGWRIADESEADLLRSEAVADAVAGAGKLELLDLLRDLQKQAVGQSVHRELLEFTKIGREALLESRSPAWERIEPLPGVDADVLAKAVAGLAALALPTSKSGKSAGKEKTHWVNGRRRLVDCAAREDWSGVLDVGLALKVCANEAQFDRATITAEHLAVLAPLVARALREITEHLARQNRASRALLERHEECYRILGRERGLLDFSDLPEALAPISGIGSSAGLVSERGVDLEHRLDGRIDHLLLDEFQDTAPVQWRVLRPIADGILGDAGGTKSFFCVGDVKQSIYGWRAAEPRLLRDLAKKRPKLAEEVLSKSYRSSRAVLDAVNRVFAKIAENAVFTGEDRIEKPAMTAAAEEFQRSFTSHESAREPGAVPPGAVFFLRARMHREEEAEHAPTIELAVERVRGILADAPLASVGVLMRQRKWIPELIRRLREAGIAASDEGGNPLTDSVAVLHALSLLHLADHPRDLAAAFHVATSPLAAQIGLAPAAFADVDVAGAQASAVARDARRSIAVLGFGGWLASIRPKEGNGYGEWDLVRFGQLVDLALAWESRAGSRPKAFVDHVRKTKVEDPSAAQVRVMTVHGAKGLEFDAVVLPELDGRLAHREDRLLTSRPDPEGEIEVVTHGLPKAVSVAHAALERVRAEVEKRRMVEELCVLYVAMTRAKHRLDLIVRGREKEGGGLTFAAMLRAAFGVEAAGAEVVAWESPVATKPWFRKEIGGEAASASRAESDAAPPVAHRVLRLAPSTQPRSLPRFAPSSAHEVGTTSAASILRPRDAMTARGRLIHRLFQEVEWIETFDRSDEELLAIGRKIEADEKIVAAALADFRAALARPTTRSVLTRPAGEVEVWRERSFTIAMQDEDGTERIASGAFDRVVLRREGGRTVSAVVIDYKSDRVERERLEQRADAYRGQMRAYQRALARMTGLEEGAVGAQLLFLHPDSVVEVR